MDKSPETRQRRPGGRSARVAAAVFDATLAMMREQGIDFSIPEIAARSGVHDTTIYRRWGTKEALIVAAVTSHIDDELPIPDTGSLRGDLLAFLGDSVSYLSSPMGSLLVQATASNGSAGSTEARRVYWSSRFDQIEIIFERAIARGEISATVDSRLATEMLLAPLYLRVLVTHEALQGEHLPERIADLVVGGLSSSGASSKPPRTR